MPSVLQSRPRLSTLDGSGGRPGSKLKRTWLTHHPLHWSRDYPYLPYGLRIDLLGRPSMHRDRRMVSRDLPTSCFHNLHTIHRVLGDTSFCLSFFRSPSVVPWAGGPSRTLYTTRYDLLGREGTLPLPCAHDDVVNICLACVRSRADANAFTSRLSSAPLQTVALLV
jgi:hypothetical protein